MSKRRHLTLEGELNKTNLNVLLAQISQRLDMLEGRSGGAERVAPLNIQTGLKGSSLRVGNMSFNTYGDDSSKAAWACGAYMDDSSQWIATQTIATILEFDTTQNMKIYYNTGLTPNVPFTPTLDYTLAL